MKKVSNKIYGGASATETVPFNAPKRQNCCLRCLSTTGYFFGRLSLHKHPTKLYFDGDSSYAHCISGLLSIIQLVISAAIAVTILMVAF